MLIRNWGRVRESGGLDPGNWTLEIDEIGEDLTDDGRKRFIAKCHSVRPFPNVPHTERFYIGTQDDPLAEDPVTLEESIGLKILKTMLIKAKVKGAQAEELDTDRVFPQARGHRFDVVVDYQSGKKGTENENKQYLRLRRFFEEGVLPTDAKPKAATPQVGVRPTPAAPAPGQRPVPRAGAMPAPSTPTATRPAPRPAPARTAAPQPSPEEEYEDVDADTTTVGPNGADATDTTTEYEEEVQAAQAAPKRTVPSAPSRSVSRR